MKHCANHRTREAEFVLRDGRGLCRECSFVVWLLGYVTAVWHFRTPREWPGRGVKT